ncbi:uncharacterized protein LOC134222734 [Armigeres subalbatus]|uniref:uncharacterized protein LOC134222734 n=1 Tax=Armigeres subalbatus TaxID=124917 RepID=UPI002ED1F497
MTLINVNKTKSLDVNNFNCAVAGQTVKKVENQNQPTTQRAADPNQHLTWTSNRFRQCTKPRIRNSNVKSVMLYANCDCVKITRLSVPRSYILAHYHRELGDSNELFGGGATAEASRSRAVYRYEDAGSLNRPQPPAVPPRDPDGRRHNEHLILDCEYEIDPDESMFVLKWLFNGKIIYQWIPPVRAPFGFTAMGRQINRTYTINEEPMHKHRALALVRPLKNFTGEYTCSVSTFQSQDMQSARMVMIVPETNFVLRYYSNNISNLVMVLCSVYGIFPAPELSLWINEYRLDNVTENILLTQSDLYDSSISIHLVLYERIQQDDVIKCTLGVKNTEYLKTKETVFVDVNSFPVVEHNSVFDHVSTTISEPSSSSTESTSYFSTSSTALPTRSDKGFTEPTTASTSPSPFTTPTSRLFNEVYKEPDAVKHPAAVTVLAPTARVVLHHFAPSLQPAVVRLKPTPPRIFTAGGEQPGAVDSDEVTNVVNFKEVFNENMLYSSGSRGALRPGGSGTSGILWRLSVITPFVLTVTTTTTLMMKMMTMLRSRL